MTQSLLQDADRLFDARRYADARPVYLQAAEMATASGDRSTATEAYAMAARTHLIVDENEQGRPWLAMAAELASPEDLMGWSRYLGVRGRFEWQDGDLPRATATFEDMYAYCSQRKMHHRAIDAAHMIAITAPPEQQIVWAHKGIKEAEEGNVHHWLGPLWNNLAGTCEELGRLDDALDAYRHAREHHYRHGTDRNKLIADWSVGHAHRVLGQLDEAELWLAPLAAWCQRLGEVEFLGWSHFELGQIADARGQPQQALAHLLIADEKLREAKMPEWDHDRYASLVAQIAHLRNL